MHDEPPAQEKNILRRVSYFYTNRESRLSNVVRKISYCLGIAAIVVLSYTTGQRDTNHYQEQIIQQQRENIDFLNELDVKNDTLISRLQLNQQLKTQL